MKCLSGELLTRHARWDRDSRLTEIDLADHFADRNHVVVEQNGLTRADAPPIDKCSIFAAQIANSERVIVKQQDTVMTADEFTIGPEQAVFFPSNQEFSASYLDCFAGVRTAQNSQPCIHFGNTFRKPKATRIPGDCTATTR